MNPESNPNGATPLQPLITIATVTFNASATLERTLKSVASQDYARIEHMIVDGCSTDNTLSIVQRYVEQNNNYHTIRLFCEPDDGLYDAMNKAIQNASGDYIVFLNAGDKLHDTHTISKLVKKADWIKGDYSNPAILYGETDIVDEAGNFIRHRRLSAPQLLTADSFKSGMMVCHQSFYVRTDLAKEERYDLQYKYSADYDWCIRLIKKAQKRRIQIVNTDMILTDYLSEGMTTKNHKKSLIERFKIMALHYGQTTAIGEHLWFIIRAIIKK